MVQRNIGIPEERLAIFAVIRIDADADAGRSVQFVPGDEERPSESVTIFRAISALSSGRMISVRMILNSSAPMRAIVSDFLTCDLRREAASLSRTSPAWWPRVSFISLNRSRSRKRIA